MSKVPCEQKSQLVDPRVTFLRRVIAGQITCSSVSNTVENFLAKFDTFMPIFGCQRYLANKKVNWLTPVGPSCVELSQVKIHVLQCLILLKSFFAILIILWPFFDVKGTLWTKKSVCWPLWDLHACSVVIAGQNTCLILLNFIYYFDTFNTVFNYDHI